MRLPLMFACAAMLAAPVHAQEATADCDAQMVVVMKAVDARRAGDSADAARDKLRAEYDQTAADMLIEFVYGVPEAQIDEIEPAYRAQCEAM
ncbi:hypothetical protein [Tropicibacter oceani]|uniref:Uncharacterized protein n=1 Tax=Tropicibacter oceani TaxID=3058420 RepID=A0ABY8QJ63_9RHOB|nr:hypothetical protein [Tropicibacter oceani]WGW03837.1 hypothetical protein QF118_18270 [Tropicibacter oceani]